MKCDICGGQLVAQITSMPFKLTDRTIVILKDVPVLQCDSCGNFLIEDPVMVHVEELLDGVDASVELEILRYAA